jgi:hypothetical protein
MCAFIQRKIRVYVLIYLYQDLNLHQSYLWVGGVTQVVEHLPKQV